MLEFRMIHLVIISAGCYCSSLEGEGLTVNLGVYVQGECSTRKNLSLALAIYSTLLYSTLLYLLEEDNLSIMDKIAGPNVSFILETINSNSGEGVHY